MLDAFLALRGITLLSEITDEVIVEDFQPWRKSSIIAKTNAGKEAKRLQSDLVHLSAAWNFARKDKAWGKLGFAPAVNPFPAIKKDNKPGANPERETLPFNATELQKLYSLSDGETLSIRLLRHTGLRRSDATQLTWKEVDLDSEFIARKAQKNEAIVRIPIHSELLSLLYEEYSRRNPRPTETVLLNPETGNALTPKALYRRLQSLGTRIGVDDVRPHRFRDTFAVDALMKTGSLKMVAAWLGDTVETVAAHYSPIVDAMQEQAREALERVDKGLEVIRPGRKPPQLQKPAMEPVGVAN